jgi:VanZ family protein
MHPFRARAGDASTATSRRSGGVLILLVLFGLFIAYGTLIPFDFSATREQVEAKRQRFVARTLASASRTDVISNVLLFLPWGGLMAVWLARRGAGLGTALVAGTVSGAALSGLVEALQLYAPSRTPSWIDLATNTAGSALGVVVGWLAARVLWPRIEADLTSQARRRPLAVLTAVAALGVLIASLAPFDVSIDVGDLKASIREARLVPFRATAESPWPPGKAWAWASEGLMWTIFGGLCALAWRESRCTGLRVVVLTVTALVGLSAVIELAQLTIGSRTTDATSVVLAAAGGVVGAFAVLRSPRRTPRDWVIPALGLWALAIVLEAWTPPTFVARSRRDLSWDLLVPFLAYYRRTDIYALADIVVQTLRYVPLGALLAMRFRWASGWRAGAIGLGVGLVMETGQFFMEDRIPEITDALSAAAGSWLGVALAKHAAELLGPAVESRGEARYSYASGGRTARRPARLRPAPARNETLDDARRLTGDVWRAVRARLPENWQRNLKRAKAGFDWLDAQSSGVQLAAVCVGVIGFMTVLLMILRALGRL